MINKARNTKSVTEFASECGISQSNLSKILNSKSKQAPSPETLKKIAANSNTSITYNELLIAAGHLTGETPNITNEEIDLEKKIEEFKITLKNNKDRITLKGEKLTEYSLTPILDSLDFGLKQSILIHEIKNKYK